MTSEPLVVVHNRDDPLSLNVGGHLRSALTTGELRREFVRVRRRSIAACGHVHKRLGGRCEASVAAALWLL
jgi:hypothetical protein